MLNRLRQRNAPGQRAHAVMALGIPARHKSSDLSAVTRLNTTMRRQVYDWRPAARHAQEIAFAPSKPRPLIRTTQDNLPHSFAAKHIHNRRISEQFDFKISRLLLKTRLNVTALVGDNDGNSLSRQIERRCVRAVVICRNQPALSENDSEPVQIATRCRRQHDTGPVVVGENQRPLRRTRGVDNRPSTDRNYDLARLPGSPIGLQVIASLHQGNRVGVVDAQCCRSPKNLYVGERRELCLNLAKPDFCWAFHAFPQEAPSQQPILFDDKNPCSSPPGSKRSSEPSRSRSDHEHVGKRMSRLVSIRIALVDRAPEPRGSTDEPLIEHPGAASGPHESLVVEAADKQRREPRIDGHQVKGSRRPAVLTACNEAVEQLRCCARDVRVCSSVLTEGK